MKAFKAPESLDTIVSSAEEMDAPILFLAGAIDMGEAEDWQTRLTQDLSDKNLVIANPRRDDWDSSWKQTIDDPQFNEQVTWEQDMLELAHGVVVYFSKDSKAPITFLELGERLGQLEITGQDLFVFCPEGFYRKGNVDICCQRHNVQVYTEYEALLEAIVKGMAL